MTVGLSAANLANAWLNTIRGTSAASFTAKTTVYAELHIGDPGSAGTANPSAVTTRIAINWNAASGGALAITGNVGPWTSTASETLSHVAFWDASTAGNFLWSAAMGSPHTWASGDQFTLTSAGFSLTPLAA